MLYYETFWDAWGGTWIFENASTEDFLEHFANEKVRVINDLGR